VLNGVRAISANDLYAVGASMSDFNNGGFPSNALVEHFDGKTWSTVPTPNIPVGQGVALSQLAIVSSTDIWAVGSIQLKASNGPDVVGGNRGDAPKTGGRMTFRRRYRNHAPLTAIEMHGKRKQGG
jgi:hypothetical protein